MKPTPNEGGQRAPKRQARAVTLKELRQSLGRTQADLASQLEVNQTHVSAIEMRTDHRLSTLRKYVASMKGTLEVVAVVDGERYVLRDV